MKELKKDFKEMLRSITCYSLTTDLKNNFVRQTLIEDTTKPMMSYVSSMLKLRAKIDREDTETVELFNSAHQGAMDAYEKLLNLVSTYNEHYSGALASSHNTAILLKSGGIVTKEEVVGLRDLHDKYTEKNREFKVLADEQIAKKNEEILQLQLQIEQLKAS